MPRNTDLCVIVIPLRRLVSHIILPFSLVTLIAFQSPESEAYPSDLDGDLIPDKIEGEGDADVDGIPNQQDFDSDGDGISEATEAGPFPREQLDSDGDGVPNFLDTNSNNDGIDDGIPIAVNGSMPPEVEPQLVNDNDGLLDIQENLLSDVDQDGIESALDLDSDNDGICDTFEGGGQTPPGTCRYEYFSGSQITTGITGDTGIVGSVIHLPLSLIDTD